MIRYRFHSNTSWSRRVSNNGWLNSHPYTVLFGNNISYWSQSWSFKISFSGLILDNFWSWLF